MAGPVLAHYGDVIARLTGLSRSWIGLVLLATATSLPELFTGVSAVAVADSPNIAVGDALGSCVFNLVMLVILDEMSRGEPMWRRIDPGHILTAGFGIILIGSAGALLVLSQSGIGMQIGHVSIYTPFVVVLYFVAMRAAFVYERRTRRPKQIIEAERGVTLAACSPISIESVGQSSSSRAWTIWSTFGAVLGSASFLMSLKAGSFARTRCAVDFSATTLHAFHDRLGVRGQVGGQFVLAALGEFAHACAQLRR